MLQAIRRWAIVMVLHAAGCAAAFAGEIVQVKISDLAFSPAEVTIRVGDTVEWVNSDFIDHTATANDGAFDLYIEAGKSAQLTVQNAGTFSYYCRVHPNMTATLIVVAP